MNMNPSVYLLFFCWYAQMNIVQGMDAPVRTRRDKTQSVSFVTSDGQNISLSADDVSLCSTLQDKECMVTEEGARRPLLPFDKKTARIVKAALGKIKFSEKKKGTYITNYIFNKKLSQEELLKVFTAATYLGCSSLLKACCTVLASHIVHRINARYPDSKKECDTICRWLDEQKLKPHLSCMLGCKIRDLTPRQVVPYTPLEESAVHTLLTGVCFIDGSQRIVASCADATVRIYALESQKLNNIHILKGHTKKVNAVCYVHEKIASGSDDETIRIWNEQGNCLQCLEGHTAAVTGILAGYGPPHLISASPDKTVRLWNIETGWSKVLKKAKSSHLVCDYALVQDHIAVADDTDISVHDVQKSTYAVHTLPAQTSSIIGMRFSPDEAQLALAYNEPRPTLALWDLKTTKCLKEIYYPACIKSFDYTPEGIGVAACLTDKTLQLYSLAHEHFTSIPLGYEAEVVRYAPKQYMCVTAGENALELRDFVSDSYDHEGNFTAQQAVRLSWLGQNEKRISLMHPVLQEVLSPAHAGYLAYLEKHTQS